MHKTALALSPLLLLLCMGSTDCEAYSLVTVPTSDSTAPDTYDGIWWDGEYQDLGSQDASVVYHITPGEQVIAIGSGLDQGGVKKVVMAPEMSWTCCSGGVCSNTSSIMASITDTQGGGVGSTVSNGLWVGTGVTMPAASPCNAGWTLKSWSWSWRTTATNYHNKSRTSPLRRIVYP